MSSIPIRFLYISSFILLISILVPQLVFGLEITTTSENDPVGPNDSIRIFLEIDGYQGGLVDWIITKPDGTTDSGNLSNIKAKKVTHLISRNAFDNQFGKWTVDYQYQDVNKTISVNVKPLELFVATDKSTYSEGDSATLSISTNYFVPTSATAENFFITVVDKNGEPVSVADGITFKAYQASSTLNFEIDEFLENNPYGTYTIFVRYYNVEISVSVEIVSEDVTSSIFLGTDKVIYGADDIVEINIIVSDVLSSNAVLRITDPLGKVSTKTFAIENSLTRIFLDDVSTVRFGTYQFEVEYANTIEKSTFRVEEENVEVDVSNMEVTFSLDKQQYRPGETISATFKTNQLVHVQIIYWFEDPSGNRVNETTFPNPSSGTFTIPYVLPTDPQRGPWKMIIKYGPAEAFDLFFIKGEPVEQAAIVSTEEYSGPEILATIDSSVTDLHKIQGISVDSHQNLYLVDSGNSKIIKFDSNGKLIKSWGSFGAGEGQLNNPSEIFVDSNSIHVADKGNSRIQTFDMDGNFQRTWGDSGIESQSLKNPESIAVSSSGTFYVSDSSLNKISKYDSEGKYAGHIESLLTAAAKFASSNSIISNNNDNFFVLVSNDNRILQFSGDGLFVKSFGVVGEGDGKFQDPSSIAIDSDGNLYVADSGNHRIQILDVNGKFLQKWGSLGTGPGQFMQISGIAVDSSGNVWVSDSLTNTIQKFAPFTQPRLAIPDWIKNNAKWWSEGQIGDSDFTSGIQFMIKENVISIPDLPEQSSGTTEGIPNWIKNNAGWWADGLIGEEDFVNGMKYLVEKGIIKI